LQEEGVVAKIEAMKTTKIMAGLVVTCELVAVSLAAAKDQWPTPGFLPTLQQRVQDGLNALDSDVRSVASQWLDVSLPGAEARPALERLVRAHTCAIDGAIIDRQGIMRVVAPEEYRNFEGTDLSQQAQIRRLHKIRRPVLSASFLSVEGTIALR
jgi:hypothetical protein